MIGPFAKWFLKKLYAGISSKDKDESISHDQTEKIYKFLENSFELKSNFFWRTSTLIMHFSEVLQCCSKI